MISHRFSHLWPGVPLALASAFLFGITTPLAKLLLGATPPQLLAGLLYLGAGVGLLSLHLARRAVGTGSPEAPMRLRDLPWLSAVILFGGVLGPLFLMKGLSTTDAATGSLLLNLEGLATMGLAWLVFRENVDAQLLFGAFIILLGAATLAWNGESLSFGWGALFIALACLSWGVDNNLTRKISLADPVQVAMLKGLVAGLVNICLGLFVGEPSLGWLSALSAAVVGFFSVVDLPPFHRTFRRLRFELI